MPGVVEGLARLSAGGRRILVLTNQRGVARGALSRHDLDDIHARMVAALADARVSIAGIYVCPHEIGTCQCRKPHPGLLLQAQADHPDIDFGRAVVVGDAVSDMDAGARVGAQTILVGDRERRRAGIDEALRRGIAVDRTASSLADAVARYLPAP
jgi:histidinol-phosphate phosphatase family protein